MYSPFKLDGCPPYFYAFLIEHMAKWCDGLGFMPAGTVSQAPQHFFVMSYLYWALSLTRVRKWCFKKRIITITYLVIYYYHYCYHYYKNFRGASHV